MTDDEFWSLVDLLGGVTNSRTIQRLVEVLEREGVDRVEEFAGRLSEKRIRISEVPLAGVLVRDVNDPPGAPPIPAVGDALINLHLAIIAAGRLAFEEVLGNPGRVTSHSWDFSESDDLAEAISVAYVNITGQSWVGPLPGLSTDDEQNVGSGKESAQWLNAALHGEADIPAAYFNAVGAVTEAIHHEPQWVAWWSHAAPHDLTVEINYTTGVERSSVSNRKRHAWASFRMDPGKFRGLNAGNLAYLACADLDFVLARVATALMLPESPSVPRPTNAAPPTQRSIASRDRLAELRKRHRKSP